MKMWHSRTAAPVVAIVILIPECGVVDVIFIIMHVVCTKMLGYTRRSKLKLKVLF
jgi:hypothetical protein